MRAYFLKRRNQNNRKMTVLGSPKDTTRPTVVITSTETSPSSINPIPITITFSESVTGFVVGDITVAGCTLSGFAGSGTTYTVNATPTGRTITIDVAEGVAADGGGNTNTAATQFTIVWEYAEELADTYTTAIISQLPLWESSGATADDYSSNNRDGAYSGSGVTYGETGIGDGRTSVKFTTTGAFVNWHSAGLSSAFNGAEGTIMLWAKVSAAGIWTDAAQHDLIHIRVNGSNFIRIAKTTTNNRLEYNYMAGGTQEQFRREGSNETGWMHICLTWSKSNERCRMYFNGSEVANTATLGVFAGTLDATQVCIGNANTSGATAWSGWLAHAVLLNREATAAEVANSASLPFDDPLSVSGGSGSHIFNLPSGGDINATCSQMVAGDILNLESGGTYTIGPLEEGVTGGFFTLPSGIESTHTTIHGNGATVGGAMYSCHIGGKQYIDFDNINFGAGKYWSLFVTNSSRITFTDCDFYNPATNSAYDVCRYDNSSYITMTRCDAHSTTNFDGPRAHDGFELWGPCSHFTFDSCTAYDIKSGAGVNEGHGFEVYGQLVGQICDDVQFVNCEAYNCQVGFSIEGGPNSIAHTNCICDSCDSHDNTFYGYEGIDGATLFRQNRNGTNNTNNVVAETFGSVTDL